MPARSVGQFGFNFKSITAPMLGYSMSPLKISWRCVMHAIVTNTQKSLRHRCAAAIKCGLAQEVIVRGQQKG